MSLHGFEPWTPAFLSCSFESNQEKHIPYGISSYKSGALTRLSYRLLIYSFATSAWFNFVSNQAEL